MLGKWLIVYRYRLWAYNAPMKQTLSLLSLFVVMVLASVAIAPHSVQATQEGCVYENDLAIEKVDNQSYKVKNNASECRYTITLTAYDMPHAEGEPQWIDDQEFLDADIAHFEPGDEKVLHINDSHSKYCRVQVDLNRGGQESILTPPFYYNSLAAHIYEKEGCDSDTNPTPTPSTSPVPSSTPVATASPVPTSMPTPTTTPEVQGTTTVPTSDGRSDGLGCAEHDCSGNAVGWRLDCRFQRRSERTEHADAHGSAYCGSSGARFYAANGRW